MSNVDGFNWKEFASKFPDSLGEYFEIDIEKIGGKFLFSQILSQPKGALFQMSTGGFISPDEEDPKRIRFSKKMESRGGRLIHRYISNDSDNSIFIWPHGIASVGLSTDDYLSVSALSQDQEFLQELHDLCESLVLPNLRHGHIFAIVRNMGQLSLSSIGDASIPLEAGNYTKKVLEDYNFVIKDLQSSSPSGRISIFEGEPGTGKTHLIRALLNEVNDAMFVLVSPDVVQHLAGPELLPLLLTTKHNYNLHGPIVLVLEDADRCLVTRGTDNINSIQSLLNLGDGILGSLLDIRIIATTNAKKLEMESAILRPGRLSKRLEVGPLDLITAENVFRRLCPTKIVPPQFFDFEDRRSSKTITLAEVYSLARQYGWAPEARKNNE